ncbi:MAG: hypothetical protein V4650_00110 [Pseudomonadota bacterium]
MLNDVRSMIPILLATLALSLLPPLAVPADEKDKAPGCAYQLPMDAERAGVVPTERDCAQFSMRVLRWAQTGGARQRQLQVRWQLPAAGSAAAVPLAVKSLRFRDGSKAEVVVSNPSQERMTVVAWYIDGLGRLQAVDQPQLLAAGGVLRLPLEFNALTTGQEQLLIVATPYDAGSDWTSLPPRHGVPHVAICDAGALLTYAESGGSLTDYEHSTCSRIWDKVEVKVFDLHIDA